jgi:hypothetical protein
MGLHHFDGGGRCLSRAPVERGAHGALVPAGGWNVLVLIVRWRHLLVQQVRDVRRGVSLGGKVADHMIDIPVHTGPRKLIAFNKLSNEPLSLTLST